jgi:hypothetical protein
MQIEKPPEPLPYPYTTAPQLCEMSWPKTCALDVGQTTEFFSPPRSLWLKPREWAPRDSNSDHPGGRWAWIVLVMHRNICTWSHDYSTGSELWMTASLKFWHTLSIMSHCIMYVKRCVHCDIEYRKMRVIINSLKLIRQHFCLWKKLEFCCCCCCSTLWKNGKCYALWNLPPLTVGASPAVFFAQKKMEPASPPFFFGLHIVI